MAERIGPFTVLGTLGKGAHSSILHIRRNADSRQYALKVVPIGGNSDLKYLDQAEHEFEIAQKLDHKNLIKVFALNKFRRFGLFRVYEVRMLIEYVNGKTLDTFGAIPFPMLVQIFEQVASGLAHMHRRDIYHADLKPNNIMLSKTGDVKVIDYGLAWMKGQQKNRVQGTPEYMAPEQVKSRIANEKSDIFNFGATMYRMCTFKNIPPVFADGGMALPAKNWKNLLKPARDLNPQVPAELSDLIMQCLAYDANLRPERMSEIQGKLARLAEQVVKSPDDRLEAMEWQDTAR
jgi:serine/threonine protein kinase